MVNFTMSAAIPQDAELVHESLTGNREAFGQIVGRYQSLVCSLAFSATGSLSLSEDLAQETFLTAWRQLCHLREPEKLRSWLCGIARNITYDSLRKQGREPSHRAESLEEISEPAAPEALPTEQTIIVAAVTVTAVLTTQTIVHHYRASNSSIESRGQVKLPPQEATEAAQAARDFLEANGKGDWDTVAKFWPSNMPKGKRFEDIFTDKAKEMASGLQIISLGTPYKDGPNSWVLVPYEARFKSGDTQKNNLRLGKGADGHWTWQGGF